MTDYACSMRGTLGTGQAADMFINTFAIKSSSSSQIVAAAIQSAWDTTWAGALGAIGHSFPVGVTYTEVTVATILVPGPWDPDDEENPQTVKPHVTAAYHEAFSPPLSGTASPGTGLPAQIALRCSLWAGYYPNGTQIKGGFYLPTPSTEATDGGGILKATHQTELLTGVSSFISTLKAGGHRPQVWSRVMGMLSEVTKVRIGSKVDTQRSRRNAILETYSEQIV